MINENARVKFLMDGDDHSMEQMCEPADGANGFNLLVELLDERANMYHKNQELLEYMYGADNVIETSDKLRDLILDQCQLQREYIRILNRRINNIFNTYDWVPEVAELAEKEMEIDE